MEIVKLGDILIDTPKYGAPLSALKIGKYKYLRQTDIESKEPTMFVNLHNNCFLKKGDLLISRAGMNAGTPYIHSTNEKWVYAGYLVKYNINTELADTKFIYYFLIKNIKNIKKIANAGSTMPKLNPPAAKKIEIKLPILVEQQAIIDIIEPFEKIFLKFKDLVRIDTIENCKKDIGLLIDIVEPFEKIKEIFCKKKIWLLKIIKNMYERNSRNKKVSLNSFVNVIQRKYENQKYYVDTSSIGVSSFLSREKISINKKSRANLTVEINSIIFSKMNGQNKIYPIYDKSLLENVYSTGFYNVTSNNNLHVYGFLLTNNFVSQKTNASVGTLMSGLNLQSLNLININEQKETYNNDFILEYLCIIDKIISKISDIIYLLMEKYIH
ncbi:MAG: restriction endonuclease subunit S [Mycoplasmataceae bacterium]|nr:restriction endonuclease subunit S [Mycoplasmataceae bacterium]